MDQPEYPFPETWLFTEKIKEETTSFAKVAYLCKNTKAVDPENLNEVSCQVCRSYTVWKEMFNQGRKRQRQLEKEEDESKAEWVANHKKGDKDKKAIAIKVYSGGYHGRRSLKYLASLKPVKDKKKKKNKSLKEEIAIEKRKKKHKEKKAKK